MGPRRWTIFLNTKELIRNSAFWSGWTQGSMRKPPRLTLQLSLRKPMRLSARQPKIPASLFSWMEVSQKTQLPASRSLPSTTSRSQSPSYSPKRANKISSPNKLGFPPILILLWFTASLRKYGIWKGLICRPSRTALTKSVLEIVTILFDLLSVRILNDRWRYNRLK